jgi:hypothetical protein
LFNLVAGNPIFLVAADGAVLDLHRRSRRTGALDVNPKPRRGWATKVRRVLGLVSGGDEVRRSRSVPLVDTDQRRIATAAVQIVVASIDGETADGDCGGRAVNQDLRSDGVTACEARGVWRETSRGYHEHRVIRAS